MKTYTLPEKKKKLKIAITRALKLAYKEIKILGINYKEENLLFAWYNLETKKPELIWLNKKAEITLRRK